MLKEEVANLGFEKITEDIDNFDIEGMIEPTFYNFGTKPVRVYHTVVKPEEAFLAGVHNMVMRGSFPIKFDETETAPNLLLYYGSPVKECK